MPAGLLTSWPILLVGKVNTIRSLAVTARGVYVVVAISADARALMYKSLSCGFAFFTAAKIAPTVTVLKYGMAVTSGMVATLPLAPFSVSLAIDKLYNSANC